MHLVHSNFRGTGEGIAIFSDFRAEIVRQKKWVNSRVEQLSSGMRAVTDMDLYHDAPKCHQQLCLIERINTHPIKTTAKPTPSSTRVELDSR